MLRTHMILGFNQRHTPWVYLHFRFVHIGEKQNLPLSCLLCTLIPQIESLFTLALVRTWKVTPPPAPHG